MKIQGNLKNLGLDTLINLISVLGKSGFLSIERGDQNALLYFEEGELVGATMGELQGEKAIHPLVDWNSGRYTFTERLVSPVRNLKTDAIMAYKEGMRKFFVYSSLNKIHVVKKEEEDERPSTAD